MFRFREAVDAGAIPFTVQGPENALCLDGGRTIGWEMLDQCAALGIELDRVFVQVGGGAFATCLGDGLVAAESTVHDCMPCRPLAAPRSRAGWARAGEFDQPARALE